VGLGGNSNAIRRISLSLGSQAQPFKLLRNRRGE